MKILATPLILTAIFCQSEGFMNSPQLRQNSLSALKAAKGTIEHVPNEFSRPLRTEAVLGARRKSYNIDISAEEEELQALAKRFSLTKIKKLTAQLTLARDRNNGSAGVECVQVKGDIFATVTQTCVRTNEDFEVDLEFDLKSIVRSCVVKEEEQDLGGMSAAELEGALASRNNKGKKKKKRRKEVSMLDTKQSLNEMKMKEIEDLMQDFNIEEDVVEDLNIFGGDGMLDLGELVAQTFRLKLDPYPKKPGSEPVSYSITG